MNKAQKMVLTLAGVGLMALGSSVLVAQDGGGGGSAPAGGGGGGRQGGGGRGNFNPEEFRKQMAERIKNDLGASDEDWKALGPAVEKVSQLRIQSMAGMGGMGRRGGGGGGPGGGGPGGGGPGGGDAANRPAESESQKASSELRKLLDDKGATNEDIKAKLAALRSAREKAKVELVKAQTELKEMVTPRQEAVLVNMGLLE